MQSISTPTQKKYSSTNGIYIKGNFKKTTLSPFDANAGNDHSAFRNKKAIVKNICQTTKESKRDKSAYTVQEGDGKRLNRNGILRVYNLNEPIDIPVTELLGKWTKNHIGVTLFVINDKWCTGGKVVENEINKQDNWFTGYFSRFIRFAMA